MKNSSSRNYVEGPVEELLASGKEPVLLARPPGSAGSYRIPIYAGEKLKDALARFNSTVPEASQMELELQVYSGGHFYYKKLSAESFVD